MSQKSERNISSDFVRVVATLFVICVHTLFLGFPEKVSNAFRVSYLTCNGLFFMLSGKYTLKFSGSTLADYGKYYKKKFINIVLPFLVFAILYTIYYHYTTGPIEMLKSFIRGLFDASIAPHLWFMYTLIALLISAPFISKIISHSNKTELKLIIVISLLFEGTRTLLAMDLFNTQFEYNGWFLNSWLIYFFLGYAIDELFTTKKSRSILALVGVLCVVITYVQLCLLPTHSYNLCDRSPIYIIAVSGVYVILSSIGNTIKSKKLISIISFLSKHSFTVYLSHWVVIGNIEMHFPFHFGPIINREIKLFSGIIISIILAVITDWIIINPLKKLFSRNRKSDMNH